MTQQCKISVLTDYYQIYDSFIFNFEHNIPNLNKGDNKAHLKMVKNQKLAKTILNE